MQRRTIIKTPKTLNDVIKSLTVMREKSGITAYKASIESGLMKTYVGKIEGSQIEMDGASRDEANVHPPVDIRVSTFLRLLRVYGYEVTLQPRAQARPTPSELQSEGIRAKRKARRQSRHTKA